MVYNSSMCATFRLSAEESAEIQKIIQEVSEKHGEQLKFNVDLYPKNNAPIVKTEGSEFAYDVCKWGFPKYDSKDVIFNARVETALEKRFFSDSLKSRRCLIPVTGFYEWSHNVNETKQKYLFTLPQTEFFYLGGFYKRIEKTDCFVVMTTEANESMKETHSRMPIILPPKFAMDFLTNVNFACDYYMQEQPQLAKRAAKS